MATYSEHLGTDFAKVVRHCWPWVGDEDSERIAGLMKAMPWTTKEHAWDLAWFAYYEAKKLEPS